MNMITTKSTTAKSLQGLAAAKAAAIGILQTLDAFGALLGRETAALKKSDFPALDAMQDEKKLLANRYQEQVNALNAHRDDMTRLDLTLREKLVKARTAFTLALQENMNALESMKDSTQRLANRILDAARQAVTQETHSNYSNKGQMQAYKTSTLSLNMDQKL